ncbi:unnamed protein product [Alternaria alternata]
MSQIKIADSPITGKADDGAVRSRRYKSQSLHPSTPGIALLAFVGNLACWIITGAIGYASPPCLAIDDWTCVYLSLALEAKLGVFEAAEQRIGTLLDL